MNPDTGQIGLFKFKKDASTTDHVSECIACDLAGLVGLSCAKFEIGVYKGREGSISYNIVDHKGIVLIEGIYCISSMYHGFDEELLLDVETGEKYSLDMIKTAGIKNHKYENQLHKWKTLQEKFLLQHLYNKLSVCIIRFRQKESECRNRM